MKKILFLLAMAFAFISCNENNKQKAVEKFMFENLYDYNSYQVIEFKELGSTIVKLKFRCKSAGGIAKINNWTFFFKDDGTILNVTDDNESDPTKSFIHIGN